MCIDLKVSGITLDSDLKADDSLSIVTLVNKAAFLGAQGGAGGGVVCGV